jgi:hypothetical protein
MDRRGKSAGYAAIALVVRQFSPSRIERQLLTQVFECVVTRRREAHTEVGDAGESNRHEESALAETTSSRKATRRAA